VRIVKRKEVEKNTLLLIAVGFLLFSVVLAIYQYDTCILREKSLVAKLQNSPYKNGLREGYMQGFVKGFNIALMNVNICREKVSSDKVIIDPNCFNALMTAELPNRR
jgi:hypothetical protein